MHFASKYVLHCDPEFEYVSDDEYEEGMAISDEEPWDDVGSPPLTIRPEVRMPGDRGRALGEDVGTDVTDSAPCAMGTSSSSKSSPNSPPLPHPGALPSPKKYPAPPPPPSRHDLGTVPPPPPPRETLFRAPPKKMHHWRSGEAYQHQPDSREENQRGRKFRRADTNVVSVKFDQLESPSTMHAGDATVCSECQAILSHISKLVQDGPDKVWECEFCKRRNVVDIEEEEIPAKDDVTFLVEPALATSASGPSGQDDSLIVFVIDVSGSMCVTTEVSGRVVLRGADHMKEKMQSFVEDRASQFLPYQSRNVTYISRLQAVQAAVDHQLEEMARTHTHRRVALISFNNEVQVIGDGSTDTQVIAGDKLTNIETLSKLGSDLAQPRAIKETRKILADRLFALEEGGGTALGPALVVATNMASRHAGSKVILCTDGLANVGLGRLDQEETDDLYEAVSLQALDKGVTISVITIKGTSCKLVELGKLADRTGGQVNIVDPLRLKEEFSTILADRILATNVEATFIVHRDLFVINEDAMDSRVMRKIGNVTKDSEVTFEYSRRPKEEKVTKGVTVPDAVPEEDESAEPEAKAGETAQAAEAGGGEGAEKEEKNPEKEKEVPTEFPFQLQVSYLDSDGTKALRVFTQTRPVTADRTLAEVNADLEVLGTHAAQRTAQLALAGDYTLSRGTALMHQRLAWRSYNTADGDEDAQERKTKYHSHFSRIKSLENKVNMKQKTERRVLGVTLSDEDSSSDEAAMDDVADGACALPPRAPRRGLPSVLSMLSKRKGSKAKKRSKDVEDDMAQDIYDMCKRSSSKM